MTKEAEQIIDSLDVSDDTKEHLKNEINAMIAAENLRREMLGFVPKIRCQSCNREIPYDEKYVKNNLLYVTSDWTKCLCSRCTAAWKRRKEIAEAYPDFGKGVSIKKMWFDELN